MPLTAWLLLPLLVWISSSDLLYRRIPNRAILLLLLLWPVQVALGWRPDSVSVLVMMLLPTLGGVLLILAVGFMLYRWRQMGAGDVKLMAALCLWLPPEQQLILVMATSLLGGLLALGLPLLTQVERLCAHLWLRLAARWQPAAPNVLDAQRSAGLPYGLAIAGGALFTPGLLFYYG